MGFRAYKNTVFPFFICPDSKKCFVKSYKKIIIAQFICLLILFFHKCFKIIPDLPVQLLYSGVLPLAHNLLSLGVILARKCKTIARQENF